jgi:hypothetical protein
MKTIGFIHQNAQLGTHGSISGINLQLGYFQNLLRNRKIVREESHGIDMLLVWSVKLCNTNNRTIDKPLNIPSTLPYYEG